jgi:cell division protein FtsW
MSKNQGVDKIFLFSILVLLAIGFTMFFSASMGILATTNSAQFSSIIFKQGFFGIVLGLVACFVFSKINYKIFKKYALYIFCVSFFITALTFIHRITPIVNGARRWIFIGGFSFQPVALLNIGFIIYWATWLSFVKDKVSQIKYGLLPLLGILALIGCILVKQPDNASFLVICLTGVTMFLVAGGKFKDVCILGLVGIVCLTILAFTQPYIMSRIHTFINPADNSLTSGYQVQQSLIAIGSGEFFGRGLGQSIQKYKFLPVATSDAIFSILGEELGFVGCIAVLGLFLFFVFRGLRIAVKAPDTFGGLLVVGIVILITAQSFINIASTLGIIPFSGIPLAFFSQGGTSMLVMLAMLGIVLNVSKSVKI